MSELEELRAELAATQDQLAVVRREAAELAMRLAAATAAPPPPKTAAPRPQVTYAPPRPARRVPDGPVEPYDSRRGPGLVGYLAGLVVVAAVVAAALVANQGHVRDHLTTLVALGVVALLGLAVLARRRATRREVHLDADGILTVVTAGSRHVFDLAQPSQAVAILGEPRSRGWKVQVVRRSRSPLTLDRRAVDPQRFTDAVRQWRPEV